MVYCFPYKKKGFCIVCLIPIVKIFSEMFPSVNSELATETVYQSYITFLLSPKIEVFTDWLEWQ